MIKGRVNLIIDGQWGGTGKGKLGAYLALRNELGAVVASPMLDTCHTYVDDACNRREFRQLPAAAVNEDALIVIPPGVALLQQHLLLKEIEELGCANRLRIHPNTRVYEGDIWESASEKAALSVYLADTSKVLRGVLGLGRTVLVEAGGAFSLGHTWGVGYAANITPGGIMHDLGTPLGAVGTIYGCLKTYPTTVLDSDAGPYYPDQQELTWQEVNLLAGDHRICEYEQDGRRRSVYTFSIRQVQRFVRICAPDRIFLNHVNYWDPSIYGCRMWEELPETVQWRVRQISLALEDCNPEGGACPRTRIAFLGTGPRDSDMIKVVE